MSRKPIVDADLSPEIRRYIVFERQVSKMYDQEYFSGDPERAEKALSALLRYLRNAPPGQLTRETIESEFGFASARLQFIGSFKSGAPMDFSQAYDALKRTDWHESAPDEFEFEKKLVRAIAKIDTGKVPWVNDRLIRQANRDIDDAKANAKANQNTVGPKNQSGAWKLPHKRSARPKESPSLRTLLAQGHARRNS